MKHGAFADCQSDPHVAAWGAILLLLGAIGCDNGKRITRLEKRTAELEQQIRQANAAAEYQLEAKCARDAKEWFDQTWVSAKNRTVFLTYTDHYNKSQNKCFIVLEHHYGSAADWANDITLWDVHENLKYGEFSENNVIDAKSPWHKLLSCQVAQTKCRTLGEFNGLLQAYMDD